MNKLTFSQLMAILLLCLSPVVISCGSDEDEQPDVVPTESVKMTDCSVAEGAEVDAALLRSISLTYSVPVAINKAVETKLNGECVIPERGSSTKNISIPVSLENGKDYTLTIPEGAITAMNDSKQSAPALTLHFKTKEGAQKGNIAEKLSNPKATKEAQNVYKFLRDHYGKNMLSGVQSSMSNTLDYVNAVAASTGKHPALAGFDFLYLPFSPTPAGWSWVQDYTDISAAKEQWENNGIVSYMWHWNVPNSEADFNNCLNGATDNMGFYCPGANSSGTTNFDIREALKEGTWENRCIMRDIDEVAITLKLLQDANIPILFRPLHEAAGNYTKYNKNGGAWFWWGRYGASYCKQLYQLLYKTFTDTYHLNNIIWVWTIDAAEGYEHEALEWYPGDEYVDIVGVDVYTDNIATPWKSQFDFMNSITGGKKLTTVSECGNMPDPTAQFTGNANYLWFMVWPTTNDKGVDISGYPKNTANYWKQIVGNKYILNREDMPSLK